MAWQSGSPRLAPYQKRQLSRDEFWFNENMPWCWSFPTGWHRLDGWCMCCRCWYIWISMWPNVLGASRVAGVTWFITMSRKRRIVVPSHTRWLFFPCFITTVWIVWRRWGGRTTDVLINRHKVTVTIFFVHHLSNILRVRWSSKLFEFHCLLVLRLFSKDSVNINSVGQLSSNICSIWLLFLAMTCGWTATKVLWTSRW